MINGAKAIELLKDGRFGQVWFQNRPYWPIEPCGDSDEFVGYVRLMLRHSSNTSLEWIAVDHTVHGWVVGIGTLDKIVSPVV